MNNKSFADRIGAMYGGTRYDFEFLANECRELAMLGVAAVDTGENINMDYPLTSLFRVISAIADELGERLADRDLSTEQAEHSNGAGKVAVLDASAQERLAHFAEWTGTTPPASILKDGAPSDDLLTFCKETGLSLDWLFRGDTRGLVMQAHHAAHAA